MSDGPYDPNAVEGDRGSGSQYIQVKDLRTVAIALVVLGVLGYPIYKILQGNSERHRCISNLKEIYNSINLYSGEHDNRFPPIARTEGDLVTPSLDERGRPYTWVSDVAPYMNARQSFSCPTATEAETVLNESATSSTASVPSSYGMYLPYASTLTSVVESPDQVILVAETSNLGALDTLDPQPFGNRVPDGFTMGWSDSNLLPDKGTQSVTRLAFPGSAKGATDRARHGKFIQAITADGQLRELVPGDEAYRAGGGINPHWKLPPGYRPQGG